MSNHGFFFLCLSLLWYCIQILIIVSPVQSFVVGRPRRKWILLSSPSSFSDTIQSIIISKSDDSSPPTIITDPFLERVLELHKYRQQTGNCLVPKRYHNRRLANFVSKQRQLYKKYLANEKPCSLTPDRIEMLDRLGFVWDATGLSSSSSTSTSTSSVSGGNSTTSNPSSASVTSSQPSIQQQQQQQQNEEIWWNEYETIQRRVTEITFQMKQETGEYMDRESQLVLPLHVAKTIALSQIPSKSDSGKWLTIQRKKYLLSCHSRDDSLSVSASSLSSPSVLSQEQVDALTKVDPHWYMSIRDRTWHSQYYLLCSYKNTYGDTLCKMSFRSKSLAHWCSNQRKNYNLKMAGRKTSLTDERQQMLEDIGMVWNRWEFEFQQKECRTGWT